MLTSVPWLRKDQMCFVPIADGRLRSWGPEARVCALQSKLDKSGPPKADEVVRALDGLIGHVKELSETAARLGGSAGETLLEECTAQA